jgi:hypothetical protein
MTADEVKSSIQVVLSIPDEKISTVILENGGSQKLADKNDCPQSQFGHLFINFFIPKPLHFILRSLLCCLIGFGLNPTNPT